MSFKLIEELTSNRILNKKIQKNLFGHTQIIKHYLRFL